MLTDTSNSFVDANQSIRVNVSSFSDPNSTAYIIESYNPSATLALATRMQPQYAVSISTDKPSYDYTQDRTINVSINIQNTGSIDVNELHVSIKALELNTSSQLDFTIPLFTNQIRTYNYNFGVPHAPGTYQFIINLTSTEPSAGDKFMKQYERDIVVIQPSPNVVITKYIPDRVYINDKVIETITINNYRNIPIYGVGVRDDTGFIFITNESKTKSEWPVYYIEPNGQATVQYQIFPNQIGYGLSLPAATVNYTFLGVEYQNMSNIAKVDIIEVPGFSKAMITPAPNLTPTPLPSPDVATSYYLTTTPTPTQTPESIPTPEIPGFKGIVGVIVLLVIVKKKYYF